MSYPRVKRLLDVLGALLGLIVLSPLIAGIALLVLIVHGAPVIFVQERATKGARVFRLRKFRSMRPVDPQRGWVTDEDRLTAFGRLLRSTSLDELPSLWNVLIGDMSLIGPRPLTTDYLLLYTQEQRRRHMVRGGLSGLCQVSGRNGLGWDEKFDLDIEYVDTMSFALDLKILRRTFTAVLSRQGVTTENEVTAQSYGGSLRSDLVVFRPHVTGKDRSSWTVETPAGQYLGWCTMHASGGRSQMIRFHPASDVAAWHQFPAIYTEVLRLLLNRARSWDADFAVCSAASLSPAEAQLYAQAGFRQLPNDRGPTVLPRAEHTTDEELFLYTNLDPESAPLIEMGLAS
ncbi:MAG: sugar transferase [Nesterenkonia sp.]